jgi:prepilin-type N-terminal cleavage/methylation domain-containing protein
MSRGGFSLLEVLTAVVIAGILAGLGTVSFLGWRTKHEIETEIRETYADLMNLRIMAVSRNMAHFASLGAGQLRAYEDTSGNGTLETGSDGALCLWSRKYGEAVDATCPNTQSVSTRSLPRPIKWGGNSTIRFDSRGLVGAAQTICIDYSLTSYTNASYDCIDLSQTRVGVGKLADPNGECNSANCRKKR